MKIIPLPAPSETDLLALERYDSGCRIRALIERAIVRHLLTEVIRFGYTVAVDDGEEIHDPDSDVESIMDNVFAVDECRLRLWKDGRLQGSVFLVFGNDGYDCIADYHVKFEELLKPTNDYAEALSAWF